MGSTLSVVASVAIIRSTVKELVPEELRNYLWTLSRRFSPELTMVIKESHDGSNNHLFDAARIYLGGHAFSSTSSSAAPTHRLTAGKNEKVKNITYGLDRNSEVVDIFHGVPMKWKYSTDFNSSLHLEIRWYELRFHKKYADAVMNKYLPHVLDVAKAMKDQNRVVKFYTIKRDRWSSNGVNLDHPMTFDTIAMDGDLKRTVIDDLDGFINGKEYYKRIGKVWKRGYLLYGPPGTGKSSLIAAMANYLNFDIYNLNLSAIASDSILEYLLLHVSNRSILVVEDIDCSIKLQNREAPEQHDQFPRAQVTLSGMLNAVDGLLSCCGDERIMVFTTNYKDRIDPALLRAGRMDMHICLSYCTFSTFKQLAANYLEIKNHTLFSEIEKLLGEIEVSPADVAGELMRSKDSTACLESLIRFMKEKGSKSKLADDEPKEEDVQNPKQEGETQVCNGNADLANNDSSNCDPLKPRESDSDSAKFSEYTVKPELEDILKAVVSKYGDIAAGCSLKSTQCRSSFLEIVCDIIQKLQVSELKNLRKPELKSMITKVQDLESVNLKLCWLHKRLDEIAEAMGLVHCFSVSEEEREKIAKDIKETEREREGCKTETPEEKSVQVEDKLAELKGVSHMVNGTVSGIEERLNFSCHGSLVDGLL